MSISSASLKSWEKCSTHQFGKWFGEMSNVHLQSGAEASLKKNSKAQHPHSWQNLNTKGSVTILVWLRSEVARPLQPQPRSSLPRCLCSLTPASCGAPSANMFIRFPVLWPNSLTMKNAWTFPRFHKHRLEQKPLSDLRIIHRVNWRENKCIVHLNGTVQTR